MDIPKILSELPPGFPSHSFNNFQRDFSENVSRDTQKILKKLLQKSFQKIPRACFWNSTRMFVRDFRSSTWNNSKEPQRFLQKIFQEDLKSIPPEIIPDISSETLLRIASSILQDSTTNINLNVFYQIPLFIDLIIQSHVEKEFQNFSVFLVDKNTFPKNNWNFANFKKIVQYTC